MINIKNEETGYVLSSLDITEANLNNSEGFKTELIALLDKYQKKIVIDMGSIGYMDSSFLGALVSALKHAISLQTDVILVNLQPDIYNLFTLIRLDKVFKIYKDFSEFLPG